MGETNLIAWLGNKLADEKLGISQAYLFGSVTHDSYPTNDVDVLVMFKKMNFCKAKELRSIEKDFKHTFSKPIQFQKFLESESAGFQDFLSKQSNPLRLLGAGE